MTVTQTRAQARKSPPHPPSRLLMLADLVLDQVGVEHRIGDIEVHGYRLSMSWLFERLVTRVLVDADPSVTIDAQRTYPLDDDARLTIRPDLVLIRDGAVLAVADVKYKLLDGGTVPNPDVYQLITYCARLGLDTGHLIYASPSAIPEYRFVSAGISLRVHGVDLAASVASIEGELRGVVSDLDPARRAPVD